MGQHKLTARILGDTQADIVRGLHSIIKGIENGHYEAQQEDATSDNEWTLDEKEDEPGEFDVVVVSPGQPLPRMELDLP